MIKTKVALARLAFVVLASTGGWLASSKGLLAQGQPKIDRKPAPAEAKKKGTGSEKVYSFVQSTVLMMVPDGTSVRKGDLICELDSAALRDQLVNQKITVWSAVRKLESMIDICQIRAPRDGSLLLLIREGDVVGERQILFEIVLPAPAVKPESP